MGLAAGIYSPFYEELMHFPRKPDGRVDWMKAKEILLNTYRQEFNEGNLTQAELEEAIASIDVTIDSLRKKYHYDLRLERERDKKK